MEGREVEVSGFEKQEDGRREDEQEGTLSCQSNNLQIVPMRYLQGRVGCSRG